MTIQGRFEEFHAEHPEIYDRFRALANQMRGVGRTRYSADAIPHVLRWHSDLDAGPDGGFKINDHSSSRYARKLMHDDPTFATFFSTRELRTP